MLPANLARPRPAAHKVDLNGQLVIEKAIREALGVKPGSVAIEQLVDDHVEIRFYPPEHNRSLRGILAHSRKRRVPPEEWEEERRRAWPDAVRAEWGQERRNE